MPQCDNLTVFVMLFVISLSTNYTTLVPPTCVLLEACDKSQNRLKGLTNISLSRQVIVVLVVF